MIIRASKGSYHRLRHWASVCGVSFWRGCRRTGILHVQSGPLKPDASRCARNRSKLGEMRGGQEQPVQLFYLWGRARRAGSPDRGDHRRRLGSADDPDPVGEWQRGPPLRIAEPGAASFLTDLDDHPRVPAVHWGAIRGESGVTMAVPSVVRGRTGCSSSRERRTLRRATMVSSSTRVRSAAGLAKSPHSITAVFANQFCSRPRFARSAARGRGGSCLPQAHKKSVLRPRPFAESGSRRVDDRHRNCLDRSYLGKGPRCRSNEAAPFRSESP
jgi:hypothetical protein